jgi:hypothetical protein
MNAPRPLVRTDLQTVIEVLSDPPAFVRRASRRTLRSYQVEIVNAIAESIARGQGRTIVVVISRQGGKNETQAQLEAYLLARYSESQAAEMVKASPTFKPQTENAMRRLRRVLEKNAFTRKEWKRESGYLFKFRKAAIAFFSAQPDSNVVGATASLLLQCDEAQSVLADKWDRDFSPMGAAYDPTTVFWGTIWTSQTLLARELAAAREAEKRDGLRRVFMYDAEAVGAEVPAYARYVAKQIDKLGRNHPLVKTQYFLEEIDAEGGMFPPPRRALMLGAHERRRAPEPGKVYVLLIDVGGQDEEAESGIIRDREPRQDSTALTVVEVDTGTLADPIIAAPSYRAVDRWKWTGIKHPTLYGTITALAEIWRARYLVIDATGLGQGLASFLDKAMPNLVIQFVFSEASKSQLGWDFLAVIETGRWKDWQRGDKPDEQDEFWDQMDYCGYAVRPGVGKLLKWGVPDDTRHKATGAPVHDDWITSAALSAVLDRQDWTLTVSIPTTVIKARDPLEDIDRGH